MARQRHVALAAVGAAIQQASRGTRRLDFVLDRLCVRVHRWPLSRRFLRLTMGLAGAEIP
jgi:hypothetical protein